MQSCILAPPFSSSLEVMPFNFISNSSVLCGILKSSFLTMTLKCHHIPPSPKFIISTCSTSVAKPWLNWWPLHSVGNTCPILSGRNVNPRFSMCSISTNILTVLANFLGIQNSILSKNIGHDRGNTSTGHRGWTYDGGCVNLDHNQWGVEQGQNDKERWWHYTSHDGRNTKWGLREPKETICPAKTPFMCSLITASLNSQCQQMLTHWVLKSPTQFQRKCMCMRQFVGIPSAPITIQEQGVDNSLQDF